MRKWIVLTGLLLLQLVVQAQQVVLSTENLSNSFPQKWLYQPADDPAFAHPGYVDTNWQLVAPRLSFEDSIEYNGICWMRLHIWVDSTLMNNPIAVNMSHRGASEVYVDGKLVRRYGTVGDEAHTENYDPNDIVFVISLDTAGEHVIAVRFANYKARENYLKRNELLRGFSWEVDVANDILEDEFYALAQMAFVVVFVIGLCIGLALLHLFLFFFHRAERSNLFLALFNIGVAVSFLLPFMKAYHSDPDKQYQFDTLLIIALSVLTFALSGVVYELFSKKKVRFYIMGTLCLGAIVAGLYNIILGLIVFLLVLLVVVIEASVLTAIAMYKKVKGARIIGAGILFFCLFFISLVVITIANGGSFEVKGSSNSGQIFFLLGIMALLSIPLSMSLYLAWKFAHINSNLNDQLVQVKELSEKTIQQELEKKRILETQNEMLEHQVAERTKEISTEKKKSDDLLLNILPEEVAEELKEKGSTEARYFDHVSVLFTDFVDFTKAGERLSPQELVDELHTCFKEFDRIISAYGIEKIKTIGDAYLAVCGLPQAVEDHAVRTVSAALEILEFMKKRRAAYPDKSFNVRIGIHSGAVVAGIVGVKKFAYDIWGDTVNTAARMESSSVTDKINISHSTYELVKDHFECSYRGEITAKNKGEMRMYFVEGRK